MERPIEATKCDPQDADATAFERGNAYLDQRRFEDAVKAYHEVACLNPSHALAFYFNRGAAYGNLALHQKTVAEFDEATRLHQAALEDFDSAIQINPQSPTAYANRAITYIFLGRDTEAKQDVDRAAALGYDRALLDQTIRKARDQR